MPDQTGSQDLADNPDQQRAVLAQADTVSEQKPEVRETRKRDSEECQSETKELTREIHWVEKATMWSQIGLALIGIAALIIYHGQLGVMQGTLEEMKRAGQATTDQTWRAIDNMNWLAKSMDTSAKQAQESIDASIMSFRKDQRAWIGLRAVLSQTLEVEKPLAVTLAFTNSGKSPALAAHWIATIFPHIGIVNITNFTASSEYHKIIAGKVGSIGVIIPGAELVIPTTTDPPLPNKATIDGLSTGAVRLYVFGSINYLDAFGVPHTTRFCQTFSYKIGHFAFCDTYNSAD